MSCFVGGPKLPSFPRKRESSSLRWVPLSRGRAEDSICLGCNQLLAVVVRDGEIEHQAGIVCCRKAHGCELLGAADAAAFGQHPARCPDFAFEMAAQRRLAM